MPLLAEAWKRNDRDTIAMLYRRSSLLQLLVSGFLFVLIWTGSTDLFELLPAEYGAAAPVVIVIALAYLLTSAIGLSVGIIMSRAYLLDAWSSWAMLIINAVANFVLIRSMGIIGAAYATLISLVVVGASARGS